MTKHKITPVDKNLLELWESLKDDYRMYKDIPANDFIFIDRINEYVNKQIKDCKSKVREAWIKFCKYSNVGEKEPYFVFYKTDKKRFEKELGLTSEEENGNGKEICPRCKSHNTRKDMSDNDYHDESQSIICNDCGHGT